MAQINYILPGVFVLGLALPVVGEVDSKGAGMAREDIFKAVQSLSREKDLFTASEFVLGLENESAIVEAYGNLVLDCYWKAKSMEQVLHFANAGIHYCLARATTYDGFWERKRFWELPMRQWGLMYGAGLRSHMTGARGAISIMLEQGHGLIVNTTTGVTPDSKFHPNLFYDTVKAAIYRMTHGMAEECREKGIAVILLSLGDEHLYMRTWEPDESTKPEDVEKTFTPVYSGRAIAALAGDPEVMRKAETRPYLEVPDLAREYGFRDVDGRQP